MPTVTYSHRQLLAGNLSARADVIGTDRAVMRREIKSLLRLINPNIPKDEILIHFKGVLRQYDITVPDDYMTLAELTGAF